MLGVSVILSAVRKFRTWQIGGWEEITEGKGEERAVHRVTERRNDIGGEKGEKENHRRARCRLLFADNDVKRRRRKGNSSIPRRGGIVTVSGADTSSRDLECRVSLIADASLSARRGAFLIWSEGTFFSKESC